MLNCAHAHTSERMEGVTVGVNAISVEIIINGTSQVLKKKRMTTLTQKGHMYEQYSPLIVSKLI